MFEQCASAVHGVQVCVRESHCDAVASVQSLCLAHSTHLPAEQIGLSATSAHWVLFTQGWHE
jgi:hypothetical protein